MKKNFLDQYSCRNRLVAMNAAQLTPALIKEGEKKKSSMPSAKYGNKYNEDDGEESISFKYDGNFHISSFCPLYAESTDIIFGSFICRIWFTEKGHNPEIS